MARKDFSALAFMAGSFALGGDVFANEIACEHDKMLNSFFLSSVWSNNSSISSRSQYAYSRVKWMKGTHTSDKQMHCVVNFPIVFTRRKSAALEKPIESGPRGKQGEFRIAFQNSTNLHGRENQQQKKLNVKSSRSCTVQLKPFTDIYSMRMAWKISLVYVEELT